MNELTAAIRRIQQGESAAFATIIDHFQDMAVGYAYAALGERAVAEDVAQEAFIAAYYSLAALREPAAFPGWFRRIVQTQIHRVKRQRTPPTVPLAEAETLCAPAAELYPMLERQLFADQVSQAIQELPARQREVITLFYMGDYSQQEISEFLGIPASTVKMRLYHGRQRLKERMMNMVQETLYQQRPSRDQTFAQDLQAMIALLQARTGENAVDYPGVVDLQELMGMTETRAYTRLWEDATKRLVGFAFAEPAYCSLTFAIAPQAGQTQLGAEMIAWGEQQLRQAGCTAIHTNCRTDNQARVMLLTQQGFTVEPVGNLHLQRLLTEPIPTPQLPPGFTIRHLAGEQEVEQMVELHRAAFGTEIMTVAYRLAMMRVPEYNPTWDLIAVAPDGQWVAFCLANYSQAENQQTTQPTGWLDPIGTQPEFRRRGLAKALMLTGLVLLKERGVLVADTSTSTNNEAMQRTAESVGFQIKAQTNWYQREIAG